MDSSSEPEPDAEADTESATAGAYALWRIFLAVVVEADVDPVEAEREGGCESW